MMEKNGIDLSEEKRCKDCGKELTEKEKATGVCAECKAEKS
jgi:predicted amidophosphoribosyltransferase